MPGPVSDSYDPEFSTASRAHAVRYGIQEVIDALREWAMREFPHNDVVVCD